MTKQEKEFYDLKDDVRRYLNAIGDNALSFEECNDIRKQQLINLKNKLRDILYG